MIQNGFSVKIDGTDITSYCIIPLKIGNFLDEQLDEISLSVRRCPFEIFKPLSYVEITVKNMLGFSGIESDTQYKTYQMFVADDGNAQESPIGSGLYNHDLSLIEITKLSELFIVDTNTITNDLGRIYAANPSKVHPYVDASKAMSEKIFRPDNYVTPLKKGSNLFIFPSVSTEGEQTKGIYPYQPTIMQNEVLDYTLNIYSPTGEIVKTQKYQRHFSSDFGTNEGFDFTFTAEGVYKIKYRYHIDPPLDPDNPSADDALVTFYLSVISNEYPLKKWTITDVVNRLCDIVEPLQKGETPRFYLNPEQAKRFENVYAPQFSFTKSTFRECLQQCGKILHAEPRLRKDNGRYEIIFDEYGGTKQSKIAEKPYLQYAVKQNIESYATELDSNAENLVNTKQFGKVLIEPYSNGYKTVRTETLYTRIEETNMIIETQYPIYTIEKLEVGFVNTDGTERPIDITPWVFESSVYTTRLSSYLDLYPYSKAYAIMYTQGRNNITALSFKQENPISQVFENYAILNILRQATNNPKLSLSSKDGEYVKLAFRVTYTPFFNARIGQTKVNYKDYPCHATIIYNQQDNVIETQNYGENIKGVIARIGNAEKTYTYTLARLDEIPKAGELFDDDYYISAVITEILPSFIKCTVALSKDFNRLSQFIGISSVKRFSEIAQNQAVERNTLWKEYIVVGDKEDCTDDDKRCLMKALFLHYIAKEFFENYDLENQLIEFSNVIAQGETHGGSKMKKVCLPVVSSSFGNSMSYSWKYADNYSAGAKASYEKNGDITGYFQDGVPYTDYYGQIYYYNFDIRTDGASTKNYSEQTQLGLMLPSGEPQTESGVYVSTKNYLIGKDTPITLRKDNREILQCNFQVDFVSNQKDLIIGSGLAANNPSIRNTGAKVFLCVLNEKLNKFTNHLTGQIDLPSDFWTSSDYADYRYYVKKPIVSDNGLQMSMTFVNKNTGSTFMVSGESWVICTKGETIEETVQDIDGNTTTQIIQKGGDVLLAKNGKIASGDILPTIYFTKKRKIFNK